MRKIIIFIFLISINAGFGQNKVLLHVKLLLNINYGTVNFTFSDRNGSLLYSSNGDGGSSTAKIYDINTSQFPLTLYLNINYTSGFNTGCTTNKTISYSYSDYLNGTRIYLAGCTPNEVLLYSDYYGKISGAESTKGVCESIPCNQAYSTDGINWNMVSATITDIIPKDIPSLGPNYRNNLFVKSTFTVNNLSTYASGTYVPLPSVTMQLNTRTYNIIGCPPKLDTNHSPIAKGETCYNKKDGEVIYTFDRPLETGERFLFTYNPIGAPTAITSAYSDNTNMVKKISSLEYKLINISQGTYNFKYQTIIGANNPSPTSDVVGPAFTITPKAELKFTPIPIQPLCSTDKGSIEITTNGGTAPYYYILDYATENINGQVVPKKISISLPIQGLTEGNHNIKVIDSNGCIQTQE